MHRSLAVTAILALGTASSASAQVAVGLRGAANVSSPRVTENGGAPAIPYRSRSGFTVGATAGLGVTRWLTIQIEGRYAELGTRQVDAGLTGVLRVSYVEVPLVARAAIPIGISGVTPHLYAGGFVRFKTACDIRFSGTASLDLDCGTADVGDLRSHDLGVVFGGGADVRLGPGDVTLDVEYALGLRNVALDPTAEVFSRVLVVGAGYRLAL